MTYVSPSSASLHPWVRSIEVSWIEGPSHPLVDRLRRELMNAFVRLGHRIREVPGDQTDVLLTAAPFLEPIGWREALLFTARRRYALPRTPTIVTVIAATPAEWESALAKAGDLLNDPMRRPDANVPFSGLAETAIAALVSQGRRGGPLLLLERVLQAQSKSIRILLLVGDQTIREAYVFDLVGAHPRLAVGSPSDADPGDGPFTLPPPVQTFADEAALAENIARRLATVVSTREITAHVVLNDPLPRSVWDRLDTPRAMKRAGREFGQRGFFTETITIEALVRVPAISDAIADQYSEGCYATWEPDVPGLVATVTGSARPVDKTALTDDELAVIVGVRPDQAGAVVRPVEGKRNDPPSSEAVELYGMDETLPTVLWRKEGRMIRVPVARSKLHGHRGIQAYDPRFVEYVPMDEAYFHYPVSCSTEAQAVGIMRAFARSAALSRPDDPRPIAFTIIPGHGVLIVEKWIEGKMPFQLIWEAMDRGTLVITPRVPQGPFRYVPGPDGRMIWPD